jgi:transcription initiation factor IIE alpha subunit
MTCRICKEAKDHSELVINHTTPVKIHYKDICKVCAGKKAKIVNELRKLNPYPEKDHVCPICQKQAKKYYLDHNWEDGSFRGWLCNACNVALGLLKDDIAILYRAIAYLSK